MLAMTLPNGYHIESGSGGTKRNHQTLMVRCPAGPIIRRKQLSRVDSSKRDAAVATLTAWAAALRPNIGDSPIVVRCDDCLL